MNEVGDYQLVTPEEVALDLAKRLQALRLLKVWKQSSLARRAGVSLGTLRRFEQTGKISLDGLLRLSFALGRLSDFEALLHPPPASSMAELAAQSTKPCRKRGTQ
ncbi:MAG: helix-turn-helix domain-containing protein [Kiritimatiellia bacterium]